MSRSSGSTEPQWLALALQIRSAKPDATGWPQDSLAAIAKSGAYQCFVPESLGGLGSTSEQIVAAYVELAAACLTSTFVVTQRVAALKRIAVSTNSELRDRLLPDLLSGQAAATVGISHLTTSRLHLGQPALTATRESGGFRLCGFSPWVTGADHADWLVVGAQLEDGAQVLVAVTPDTFGVTVKPYFELVGLTGSHTGTVEFRDVEVPLENVVAGPIENVLATMGTATGGFQTSALAVGLSQAAIEFLASEGAKRADLIASQVALEQQLLDLKEKLSGLAKGQQLCSKEELRRDANSLVLRSTQAALGVAKGTGYVSGHPVGRWCQEALFFLVWSCPQPVLNANLCEFAGLD